MLLSMARNLFGQKSKCKGKQANGFPVWLPIHHMAGCATRCTIFYESSGCSRVIDGRLKMIA